jgi:hypothetical protein
MHPVPSMQIIDASGLDSAIFLRLASFGEDPFRSLAARICPGSPPDFHSTMHACRHGALLLPVALVPHQHASHQPHGEFRRLAGSPARWSRAPFACLELAN